MWDLTPIAIKPAPPALEGKVLISEPPGKSLSINFQSQSSKQFYPEQGINCQWFQEEPADSSEALAKLAQVSMLPFHIFLQSQFWVTYA